MDSAQGINEVCTVNRTCWQDAVCVRNWTGFQEDKGISWWCEMELCSILRHNLGWFLTGQSFIWSITDFVCPKWDYWNPIFRSIWRNCKDRGFEVLPTEHFEKPSPVIFSWACTSSAYIWPTPHLSVLQSSICIIGKILPIYSKSISINLWNIKVLKMINTARKLRQS